MISVAEAEWILQGTGSYTGLSLVSHQLLPIRQASTHRFTSPNHKSEWAKYSPDTSSPGVGFFSQSLYPVGSVSSLYNLNLHQQSFTTKVVYINTTSSSTANPGFFNQSFEKIKAFLQTLANDYTSGALDIPEITHLLGEPWTESRVVLLLEILGAHRPISREGLSEDGKISILTRLAQVQATTQGEEYNDADSIQREVIASQRIESIYVLPEDLEGK